MGERARAPARARSPSCRSRSTSTRPATSGRGSRATRPETVVIGSHIDSVPNGGWLDGALGVMGALETLRSLAEAGTPPCTVDARRLGRRGGRALRAQPVRLLGGLRARSIPTPCATCATPSGARLEDALARARRRARPRARGAARGCATCAPTSSCTSSRGPVLEGLGLPVGTVLGTVGVERHRVIFRGQAAHAGSTPMTHRRDSFLAAARFALARARGGDPPRRRVHDGRRRLRAGRRHGDRRRDRAAARPAPPRRGRAGRDAGRVAGRSPTRPRRPRAAPSSGSRSGASSRSRSTPA